MPNSTGCWGLEIGSNAIKALRLARHGTEVVVTDYAVMPFKKVLTTPDINPDEMIQIQLDQFLSRYDIRKNTVMVSVPGNMAFAKFAKLPPVDPKKIPDIVQFEAVQQIPFPIDQVEWDYQVFAQHDSPDVEIGIFAITKERVLRILSNYQAVGLHVDGLTLSALAVYNAMAYDLKLTPESQGLMLMDIGTTCTDVIIIESGNLWLRTFQIGGNNFTEALIRSFKLSYSKAEKLKRDAGTSKYTRQIFQAMRPVFADLVQELQKTMGFYMSMNRDARLTRLVGMGSTFRLPGLQKFLKQQLQIEVVRLDGFKRISVEGKQAADFVDRSLNLSTAYGLALQGLGVETVCANILPTHIVKQRVWKAKQPWIATGAAVLLGATIAGGVRLGMIRNEYENQREESESQIRSVVDKAEAYKDRWYQIEGQSDPRQRIENLRRILDYRELWPLLLYDLNQALMATEPQPELMEEDFQKISRLPRGSRRRIFIESMSASYQGQPKGDDRPSFQIVVKGTTPYSDASSLISHGFIRWLKDNSERDDRPYRLVVPDRSLTRLEPIVDGSVNEQGSRNLRGGQTPQRRSDAGARSRTGVIRQSGKRTDWGNLFPRHPQAQESRSGDSRFEIRWIVELLRPDQARQAEEKHLNAEQADASTASEVTLKGP